MVTGSVMYGSDESGVMVCTPVPEMLNAMRSVPAVPLALVMAQRSEPSPLSLVLVTVNVAAVAANDKASHPTRKKRVFMELAGGQTIPPACNRWISVTPL